MPIIREILDKITIILEFLRPEYLNMVISFLLKRLIKNNCVVSKNINGKTSKIKVGELSKANDIIKFVLTSKFLKKSNSLKILSIITRPKVTEKTNKNDFKNKKVINLMYVFIF